MNTERFKLLAVVYMILRRGDEVLLSLRQNTGFADNQYSLVAGHLDGNERATEGLRREILEEAGIDVKPENMKLALTMHGFDPGREAIDLFFTADKWTGNIVNNEPHKCGGLDFFNINNLPDNIVPYIRDALRAIEQGVTYLEDGWE